MVGRVPEVLRSYLRIVALLPSGGRRLLAALLAVNLVLGVLPVTFVVATSLMIGRVPAAVVGGVGSPAWDELVVWFALAAAAFVVQQIVAPLQVSLGELFSRRIDGQVYDRLIAASLRTPGIAPLEDRALAERPDRGRSRARVRVQDAGQRVRASWHSSPVRPAPGVRGHRRDRVRGGDRRPCRGHDALPDRQPWRVAHLRPHLPTQCLRAARSHLPAVYRNGGRGPRRSGSSACRAGSATATARRRCAG